jgi:hypothetical protein
MQMCKRTSKHPLTLLQWSGRRGREEGKKERKKERKNKNGRAAADSADSVDSVCSVHIHPAAHHSHLGSYSL